MRFKDLACKRLAVISFALDFNAYANLIGPGPARRPREAKVESFL